MKSFTTFSPNRSSLVEEKSYYIQQISSNILCFLYRNIGDVSDCYEQNYTHFVTTVYFAYKTRAMKVVEVKFRDIKHLHSMHICIKFQRSTFRHLAERRFESCQNVSALPADKPWYKIHY
jgi:hypothetical protein